jgi:hypothetical protein
MKSRQKELLNRSIHAAVAAIEIYNKPNFLHREELFSVLLVNSWELLVKAKWLSEHKNDVRSLYIRENVGKKDGTRGKKIVFKLTRSGSYFTHSLESLAQKLVSQGKMHPYVWNNIQGLIEIRDVAVHFYNSSPNLFVQLQELGAAGIRNYVAAVSEWFDEDLSKYNLFLMPLAFISPPKTAARGIVTNRNEENLLAFIEALKPKTYDEKNPYSVCVNIEVKLERSTSRESPGLKITGSKDAIEVKITDEQFRERYPLDYPKLTHECRKRYIGFKADKKFTAIRKPLCADSKFSMVRFLDTKNPKSARKTFYSQEIFKELDKYYRKHD